MRRTRLAEGEQPTLFQLDGYKYSCFVATTSSLNLQLLDARHRAHARVEDQVRTTKDTGLGHLSSKSWDINSGWCQAVAIAADLLAWFKLLGCTGELARAEPKALRYRLLAGQAHPRAAAQVAAPTRPLALVLRARHRHRQDPPAAAT